MPDDLAGLCKFRVGSYRILYWRYAAERTIKVFRVEHRSKVYEGL